MQIILASASPYRAQILEQAGLNFRAQLPNVNGEYLKQKGPKDPLALCAHLAQAKARSLLPTLPHRQNPNELIIGGDQLVLFAGQILGKAGDAEKARAQLQRLQGQQHQLITSLCLLWQDQEWQHTDVTELTMRPLSDHEIATYVELDQTWDCAGSYKIERAGMLLMESMNCVDPTTIQGLSLSALAAGMKSWNLSVSDFWRNA